MFQLFTSTFKIIKSFFLNWIYKEGLIKCFIKGLPILPVLSIHMFYFEFCSVP